MTPIKQRFLVLIKALLLFTGIATIAYITHQPGDQLLLSFIGGLAIGIYVILNEL